MINNKNYPPRLWNRKKTNQKGIPKAVPGKEGTAFGMMRNEARLKPFHQRGRVACFLIE